MDFILPRTGTAYRTEAKEAAEKCGMDESQMIEALKAFHDVGFLLYYGDFIPDTIFMQPQQLIDVLRTVITVRQKQPGTRTKMPYGPRANVIQQEKVLVAANDEDGRVLNSRLCELWAPYKELVPHLRKLLKHFGLALPDPNQVKLEEERDLIVPCLALSTADKTETLRDIFKKPQELRIKLKREVHPLGFASRLSISALQLAQKSKSNLPKCILFEEGCAFSYQHNTYVRLDFIRAGRVHIKLQQLSNNTDEEIKALKSLLEEFKKFFEEQKIDYSVHVKCFNCNTRKAEQLSQYFTCNLCEFHEGIINHNYETLHKEVRDLSQNDIHQLATLLDAEGAVGAKELIGRLKIPENYALPITRSESPTKQLIAHLFVYGTAEQRRLSFLIEKMKGNPPMHPTMHGPLEILEGFQD